MAMVFSYPALESWELKFVYAVIVFFDKIKTNLIILKAFQNVKLNKHIYIQKKIITNKASYFT